MHFDIVYNIRTPASGRFLPSVPVRVQADSPTLAMLLAKERLTALFNCEIGTPVRITRKVVES